LERFPCTFSADQGYGPRDEFPPDSPTAIESALAETLRSQRPLPASVDSEKHTIPRGFGRRGIVHTKKWRRQVRGSTDAAARVYRCCQFQRFGFALDSPQRRAVVFCETKLQARISFDLRLRLLISRSGVRVPAGSPNSQAKTNTYLFRDHRPVESIWPGKHWGNKILFHRRPWKTQSRQIWCG
jgi:hypothetical protein